MTQVDATITDRQWTSTRKALAEAGERFADLLVSVPEPRARATRDWSIVETAAHVVGIASSCTVLVRPDRPPSAGYDFLDLVPTTNLKSVASLNASTLRDFAERDPAVLAKQVREAVAAVLERTEDQDPNTAVDWLAGSRAPIGGLVAHLVNELLIHGHDIARAVGVSWPIPSWQAALFVDVFLVGVLRAGAGRLLDPDDVPAGRRIAVEFRSRYTTRVTLVLGDGRLAVDESGGRPDVRVSFEPATLNLVMFRRRTRVRAMLAGKVLVWGRRPWLLFAFLRVVRMP